MSRTVQEIRETGAAWVTETELEALCEDSDRLAGEEKALERIADAGSSVPDWRAMSDLARAVLPDGAA